MAKLILSLDGQAIKEHDVSKERMTIGRKPHNDIQIDNLAVSGEHAMIMTILNDSFLEDLGSTNGTMVNGLPVKKHFLQNEDIVEIGKYKLKYENAQAGKVTQQEFEQTMVLRAPPGGGIPAQPPSVTESPAKLKSVDTTATATGSGGAAATPTSTSGITTNLKPVGTQTNTSSATASVAGMAPAGASQAVAPAGASPQPVAPVGASEPVAAAGASPQPVAAVAAQPGTEGAIQILSGPNAGRELPLSKPLTTVGKPGVQVAVIAKRPQGFFITHVEGADFPIVNGKPLSSQAHQLHDHDIIDLAGVKMEFFFRN